ncbi:pilus assembly protein TadG-related protein [Streptomyces sp. Wb2n-11]|uniref:pilus assembly protein TadG-related protein n=1 Tax=Streptomyces sp. Wb2n-11 TaxID=1030533 RepID=UPI000A3F96C1|nr:pilus assembly protein TadG-related protein [Streptomyces sp. Wb2n-11]
MIAGFRQDRGQTLPMYVVVVGGLLFLAFAYFAFAQAAVARNGGQSAADAAALAAAQDVREELTDGFFDYLDDPEAWVEWLMAEGDFPGDGYQAAAAQLADENDSNLDGGVEVTEVNGYPAFRAKIETRFTVGDSVIPGTESTRAKADATAVIEPRCEIVGDSDSSELIEIDCVGSGIWRIDPKTPIEEMVDPPEANDLFSVHLAE